MLVVDNIRVMLLTKTADTQVHLRVGSAPPIIGLQFIR